MASLVVEKLQDRSVLLEVKPASYFSSARIEFVDLLPRGRQASVIEIGCGSGATGALALSEGCCSMYVGVERDRKRASEARQVLSEVLIGGFEVVPDHWPAGMFDALIVSDGFQNTNDPAASLARIAALVRTGGLLIASVPNIAHWRVIGGLITGSISTLGGDGELRSYSPAYLSAIVERAGFTVDIVGPLTGLGARADAFSRFTGGMFDHLLMPEIGVVATKQ